MASGTWIIGGEAVKTEHMIGVVIIILLAVDVYLGYEMLQVLRAKEG